MKKSLHNKLNLNYNSGIFITVLFFSILVMVQQGWAQPFSATYPFTNVTTSTGLTDPTPVPTATGVTFSSFTAVGQTAANSSASGRFAFNGQPLGATDLSNTFTGAILLTRFYQVTVTVNPGSTVNLTSISFTFQRSSTAVRQYSVRSDGDGYADNLPASISPANAALSVVPVNVFQSTDANTAASNGSFITLSGASFTGLTGGTTRTFRFYGFNAEAAGGTFGIDNVIINGNASSCTIPSPPSITATQSTCQPGCILGGGSFNINSACGVGTTLTYYTSIAGTTTTSAPVYNQTTPMTIYYACVDNISGCKSAIQTLTTVPGSCPPAPSGASITAIESTCQPGCAVSGGSFNINTSCGAGTTLTYFTDNSGLTTTGAPTYNQTSPMSVYYACVDDVTGCKSPVQTLTTLPGTCITPSTPLITATESSCQPGCILGGGSFNINSSCGTGTTLTYYTDIDGLTTTGAPTYDQSSPITIFYACVNNTTGCRSAIQTLTTIPGNCTNPSDPLITATESSCLPGCNLGGGSFNINSSCGTGATLTYFTDIDGFTTTGTPTYNQSSPMTIFYACVNNISGCRSTIQTLTTVPGSCPAAPSNPEITATESSCQPGCNLGGGSFNINTSCGVGTTLTYFTNISGVATTGTPTYNQTTPMTIFYACVDDISGCKSSIQTLTTVPGTCINPPNPTVIATESTCQAGCTLGGGSFQFTPTAVGYTLTFFTDISGNTTTGSPTYDQTIPMTIYYANVDNVTGCRSAIQSLTTIPGTCTPPSDPLITTTESTCQSGCTVSGGSFIVNTSCGAGSTLTYYTDITGATITSTPVYNQTSATTIYYACVDDVTGCASTIQSLTTIPGVCTIPADPSNPQSDSPQCASVGVTINTVGVQPIGETWYWQTISGGTSIDNSGGAYNVNASGTYYIRSQDNSTLCWSNGEGSITIAITPDPVCLNGGTVNAFCGCNCPPGFSGEFCQIAACITPGTPIITATESTCQSGCVVSGGSLNVNTSCGVGTTLTYFTDISGSTSTSAPTYNQTSPITIYYACVDNSNSSCRSAIQTLTTAPGTCTTPSDPLITATESTCQAGCTVGGGSFNVNTSCGAGTTLTYYTDISGTTTTSAPTYNQTSPMTIYYACVDDVTGCRSAIQTLTTVPGVCTNPPSPTITVTESTCQAGCLVDGGTFNIAPTAIGYFLTYFTDISGNTTTGAPTYNQTTPMTIYYANVDGITGCRSAIQSLTTVPGTCTTPSNPLITATESTCQSGCVVSGGSFNVNTSCGVGTTLTYFTDISGSTTTSSPTYNQTSAMTIYYACVDDLTGCRSAIQTLTTVPGTCTTPSNPLITATESACQAGCTVGGGSFNVNTSCGAGTTLTYFTNISGTTTTSAPTYNQASPMTIYYACVDDVTGCRSAIQTLTTVPGVCTNPPSPTITATQSTCQAGCLVNGGTFNIAPTAIGYILTYFTDISGNTTTGAPTYNQTTPMTIYYANVDGITGCRSVIQSLTTVPGTCTTPSNPLITATESTCQTGCTVGGGSFNVNTSCGVGTTLTYFTDISGSTTTSAPTYNQTTAMTIYYACVNDLTGCRSAIQTLTTVPGICIPPSAPTITPSTSTTFCSGGSVVLSSDAASGNQWYQGLTLLTAETNQTYTATTNGSYTVTTTNGLCTSTASVAVIVTVNPLPTASINYSLGSYCAPGTASVTQLGQGGGTYTSTAGLMINATTGEINVTTSTPNTYLVTYAFSDGICNDVTTASVTIVTPPFTFYADNDGDGYGSGIAIPACIQPPNTSSVAGDCDDTNFDANPSITEVCLNGIDDNCDGHIDEGCGCLNPHIALAGNDTTVCNEGDVLLNGAIAGSATSGTWGTTGTGFFTPSIASLNAVYHPSLADYANGSVKLHLTTDATIDCLAGSDTLVVTFVALPVNTGVISGITQFCSPGPTSTATYSIVDIGEYSYKWILPAGLTLLSGQGTTTITVGFDLTAIHEGIGGYLSVQAQNINGCLSNTPSTLRVTAHLVLPVQPGSISGPDKACPGDIATYSVVSVPRTDIYTWTMPIGASILSGQNTNIITVQYNGGFIGGTIKVKAGNGCGTSPDRPRAVTLNILPAPTAIVGNANGVCGETIPYTIATPVTGATDYIWTAPAGASFLGGVNTGISVSIIFSGSFTGGNISVAAINNCGNGSARVMNVIGVPGFPSSITGATSFCATQNQTFSVATVTGALTYNWTKTNGLTYVTGQTTKNYTVTFGGPVANQMLTVRAVNGCGQSNARVLSGISVVACPRLSEEISTLHLIAYPNPVADFVRVSFNSSLEQKYTLQLSDATGRVVITEVKTAAYGTNEMELSVKTLSSGMYILHFQMGEQTEQIRLFVE